MHFFDVPSRKKKLKIMAKRRRHQKTPKTVYSIHSNGTSKVPTFSHSPVRCESLEPHREEPPSLVHPAKVRKKKRKLNQPLDSNENFVNTEKKRKGSTKSTTSSSGRPLSREKHRKGKVTPERRKSGIPVPINSKKTVQERRLVENERAHNVIRHSSFENNIAVIDRNDPYTIDMDTVRSSRERRRWEIPTAQSIEYDPQRSLRLPPLLELRTVTTA